jgi:hypothetical protein
MDSRLRTLGMTMKRRPTLHLPFGEPAPVAIGRGGDPSPSRHPRSFWQESLPLLSYLRVCGRYPSEKSPDGFPIMNDEHDSLLGSSSLRSSAGIHPIHPNNGFPIMNGGHDHQTENPPTPNSLILPGCHCLLLPLFPTLFLQLLQQA